MREFLKSIWLKFKAQEPVEKQADKLREELRYGQVLLNISKSKDYPIFREYLQSRVFDYMFQEKMSEAKVLSNLINEIEKWDKLFPIEAKRLANLKKK